MMDNSELKDMVIELQRENQSLRQLRTRETVEARAWAVRCYRRMRRVEGEWDSAEKRNKFSGDRFREAYRANKELALECRDLQAEVDALKAKRCETCRHCTGPDIGGRLYCCHEYCAPGGFSEWEPRDADTARSSGNGYAGTLASADGLPEGAPTEPSEERRCETCAGGNADGDCQVLSQPDSGRCKASGFDQWQSGGKTP